MKQTSEDSERWREGNLAKDHRTQGMIRWQIPWVSFCLVYLRLIAKEAGNTETPMSADKKNKQTNRHKVCSLAKGRSSKMENI